MKDTGTPPPPPPGYSAGTQPHFEDPLPAPNPHRLQPDLPANMASNLDEQLYAQSFRGPSPGPPPPHAGYNPGGFSLPNPGVPPSRSPQPNANWSPWASPPPGAASPQINNYSSPPPFPSSSPSNHLVQGMAGLTFNNNDTNLHNPYDGPRYSSPAPPSYGAPKTGTSSPTPSGAPPSLTAPIPTIPSLSQAMAIVQNTSHDPALKVTWCRDVLFLVDRAHATATGVSPGSEPPAGPVMLEDPQLNKLAQVAVPIILQIANGASAYPGGTGMPPHVAEALYHRACLTSSGAFPEHIRQNPRAAFRDFETSARAGFGRAWFRIGRDYEGFGDLAHAKECFERGCKAADKPGVGGITVPDGKGVGSCLYRMGMAHLLGQLGLPVSVEAALPLLQKAATHSTIESPQPAYVYALLLLGEFTQANVSPALFIQLQLLSPHLLHLPHTNPSAPHPGILQESKVHMERSAFLHFAPAQYKLGHAYEFATPPWDFDALMSVEWYSRASQQGESEADMALSKWFLCGSKVGDGSDAPEAGGFDKDEKLARVFAEKAAKKGLPSAEFAMGYYLEVGIGGPKDVTEARAWYIKARDHGNTDAADRLNALSASNPQALSRAEHDTITESKLVRTRTQAKQRSEAQKVKDGWQAAQVAQAGSGRRRDGNQVVDLIRKNTLEGRGYGGGRAAYDPHGHGRHMTEPGHQPGHNGAITNSPGSSPRMGSVPVPGNTTGVGLRPGRDTRAYPTANRYTLTDPGSTGPPPEVGRQSSPSGNSARPSGRPGMGGRAVSGGTGYSGHSSPAPSGPTPSASPKPSGPQTFAEMGFTGARAQDKDCVIM
ncbi:hypothetical protein D9758_011028 [Tetrapyrgos nigripes]|uniref:HCP-like protein n=1 Tax=Tetrapyrgos nigripes TaxID=182062 RepID=A0A8H5LPG3_9AGAR|nr:hypothetical protein D9758_011028 [Tetrapyrgos nigripes]